MNGGLLALDRRQAEIRRLLALMGGSVAALYEDACRLLMTEPPLATASHVVGHLAREIESGLRDLLEAMVPADRMAALEALPRKPDQRRPSWKKVVDEICTALGFTAEDEVRDLWKSVLWAPVAHRDTLLRPRPVDEEFLAAWRDFETLLTRIGRQYEATYTAALPMVDELAALEEPTKADLSRLRSQVPHGVVALRRFFERASIGWFPRLRSAGYFTDPPALQPSQDGLVTYTAWPAGRYLVRIAAVPSLADAVVDIALQLETNNPEACESVAETALALPPAAAARLAPQLATFLKQPVMWGLPAKAGQVVVALGAAGEVDAALTVLDCLLPTQTRPRRSRTYLPRDLIPRAFPHLGQPGLRLLADRLVSMDTATIATGGSLSRSTIWRPAIETDHHRTGPDVLVSALRDAAIEVSIANGAAAALKVLDRYEPALFRRLALYVLAQAPDADLISARLTSRALFDDAETFREYSQLLRSHFPTLPAAAQEQIVGFVQAGPLRDVAPEYTDRWRLRQLARFDAALPANQRATFEDLVGRFGPPTESDRGQTLQFVGPTAPTDAAALSAMKNDDLLEMLATWNPSPAWDAPSPEGLRRELQVAVEQDPAKFAALAPRFADLDPTYGHGLLAGLTKALKTAPASPATDAAGTVSDTKTDGDPRATGMFAWAPVFTFGQAVLNGPRLLPGRPPTGDGDRHPGWIWCRQQLADLLAEGLDRDQIPPADANVVLDLLTQLTQDPEPDQDSDESNDPATTAINTVRGCAFIALMHYLVWRHHHRATAQPAQLDTPVRTILEAHLDPAIEPTAAIRTIYGQWIGALAVCDPQWARDHVEKIFDRSPGSLGAAAWEAFLRFNQPTLRTYELLAPWYLDEINSLSQAPAATPTESESNSDDDGTASHLVRHLAGLYSQGIVTLDTDSPLAAFVEHAPVALRGKLIEILGIILHNSEDPPQSAIQRLQALWEWRFEQLRATPDADLGELAGFGWWFGSGKLPLDWALPQLQALLESGGIVDPDELVAGQLVTYRTTHPDQAVTCVALLIDAATDPWFVTGSHDDLRVVLTEGLQTGNRATQKAARETLNRLVARGHASFADLLAG
ncbi:hypothetical protein Pa4123_82070 [Phytohabitans aurantiacus]|uniref:DUF4132 domain-containing protein n=1 Tax=Phytohabitans aurantiacus TaxID=3016789 RepID=A0ABQ5R833_9ACTN|nr:hypothetical protein Pa4123_82070 [Phytohabitans aurantiacus]